MVNTPSGGSARADGYEIRAAAVAGDKALFTTMAVLGAAVSALPVLREGFRRQESAGVRGRSGGARMTSFGERVRAALAAHGQLCVGIDPHAHLLAEWGLDASAAGAREFGLRVVEAAAGRVGVVKPQVVVLRALRLGRASPRSRTSSPPRAPPGCS